MCTGSPGNRISDCSRPRQGLKAPRFCVARCATQNRGALSPGRGLEQSEMRFPGEPAKSPCTSFLQTACEGDSGDLRDPVLPGLRQGSNRDGCACHSVACATVSVLPPAEAWEHWIPQVPEVAFTRRFYKQMTCDTGLRYQHRGEQHGHESA